MQYATHTYMQYSYTKEYIINKYRKIYKKEKKKDKKIRKIKKESVICESSAER
jgi:hypothetical protein